MGILSWGLALFAIAFLVQLAIWKMCLPRRQIKVLLQIFCIVLFGGFLAFWNLPDFLKGFSLWVPESVQEYLLIGLLFISMTLAYMITYSAIEVDSPSLVMIMSIAKAGPVGLSKEEFVNSMTDDLLVKPRVNDLLNDNMADFIDGSYRLTRKGRIMASIFIIYRRLLNIPKGG